MSEREENAGYTACIVSGLAGMFLTAAGIFDLFDLDPAPHPVWALFGIVAIAVSSALIFPIVSYSNRLDAARRADQRELARRIAETSDPIERERLVVLYQLRDLGAAADARQTGPAARV